MPRQLFENSPASHSYARSPWTVVISTLVHFVVIAAAIVGPLMATGVLPDVRGQLTAIMPVDIELPAIAVPAPAGRPRPTRNQNAAPIDAPTAISEEVEPPPQTGFGPVSDIPLPDGLIGVPNGVPWVPGGDPAPGPIVAPPPAAPQKPLRTGGVITAPHRIVAASPVYPAVAQAARVEGDVILDAIIDTNGTVRDVRVLRSVRLLDQAAIDAVKQWRYKPTLLNGVPVRIIMTVTISFRLQ